MSINQSNMRTTTLNSQAANYGVNINQKIIQEKVEVLRNLEQIKFKFLTSVTKDILDYFPDDLEDDLDFPELEQKLVCAHNLEEADLVIVSLHGSDQSYFIFDIRQKAKPNTLVIGWLWDNHLGHLNNLKALLHCDFYFFSHSYCYDYLLNPISACLGMAPACVTQWSLQEAEVLLQNQSRNTRSNQLLVNYVDYPYSWRSPLLKLIQSSMPEADTYLMPFNDRSRYFSKSRPERFQEWSIYKCALILPIDRDLSTRVFDCLMAGTIPVVSERVIDLDAVISPEIQHQLGIVRVADGASIEQLREALYTGIRQFDAMGERGVQQRQQYVLNEHMFCHRIYKMLEALISLAYFGAQPKLVLSGQSIISELSV